MRALVPFMLIALAGTTDGKPEVSLAATSTPALFAPLSVEPFVEPSNCGECEACAAGQHRAPLLQGGTVGALHSWCMELLCSHPSCTGGSLRTADPREDLEVTTLLYAASEGHLDALYDISRRYPDRVIVNRRRLALQIRGCNGAIAASLPLTADQLRHL